MYLGNQEDMIELNEPLPQMTIPSFQQAVADASPSTATVYNNRIQKNNNFNDVHVSSPFGYGNIMNEKRLMKMQSKEEEATITKPIVKLPNFAQV